MGYVENRDGHLYGAWPVQGCTSLGNNRYRFAFGSAMQSPNSAGTYRSIWQVWRYPSYIGPQIEIRFDVRAPATPTPSTSCTVHPDRVLLFSEPNFGGACVALGPGNYPNPGHLNPVGNDNTRSLRVGQNLVVRLYEDDNYGGKQSVYVGYSDVHDIRDHEIGYRTSSVQVESKPPTATPAPPTSTPTPTTAPDCAPASGILLYEHTYWMGRCLGSTQSIADLSQYGFGDTVSSLRFHGEAAGRYQVVLYSEPDYQGATYTLLQGHADLNLIGFNDLASSLQIVPASQARSVFLPVLVASASSRRDLLSNGDFEQGADTAWESLSAQGWALILSQEQLPVQAYNGNWGVWLGGADNEIALVRQSVTVPTSTPMLGFAYWIASVDMCGYDFGGVVVNGQVVDVFTLCRDTATDGWILRSVDLSEFGGQTVQLEIRAETDGSLNSNLFVDHVHWLESAGQTNHSGVEGETHPPDTANLGKSDLLAWAEVDPVAGRAPEQRFSTNLLKP